MRKDGLATADSKQEAGKQEGVEGGRQIEREGATGFQSESADLAAAAGGVARNHGLEVVDVKALHLAPAPAAATTAAAEVMVVVVVVLVVVLVVVVVVVVVVMVVAGVVEGAVRLGDVGGSTRDTMRCGIRVSDIHVGDGRSGGHGVMRSKGSVHSALDVARHGDVHQPQWASLASPPRRKDLPCTSGVIEEKRWGDANVFDAVDTA